MSFLNIWWKCLIIQEIILESLKKPCHLQYQNAKCCINQFDYIKYSHLETIKILV